MNSIRKHILLIMSLVLLSACGKEPGGDGTFPAVFRVGVSAGTKAVADGSHVNRYIMEVYSENGDVFYDRVVKLVEEGTLETEMEVTLHIGISYNFVFWADCSDGGGDLFYETLSSGDHGLRAVSMKDVYKGNDDRIDAFTACVVRPGHKAFEEKVVLRRPLARICVMTDDLGLLPAESLWPSEIEVGFTAYSCIDLLNGQLSSERKFEYVSRPCYLEGEGPSYSGFNVFSVDYVLAPFDGALISSMDFLASFDGGTVARSFENVPYRRNYMTNIKGSLLTETTFCYVIVDPAFDEPDLGVTL